MVVVSSLIFSLIVYQFGDALQITFANALRGTTDVKPMMWIAFFSYFIVALPVGYLCGFTWGGGVVGVWVAFPAGLFTAGFLFWLRFRYRLQQLMKNRVNHETEFRQGVFTTTYRRRRTPAAGF